MPAPDECAIRDVSGVWGSAYAARASGDVVALREALVEVLQALGPDGLAHVNWCWLRRPSDFDFCPVEDLLLLASNSDWVAERLDRFELESAATEIQMEIIRSAVSNGEVVLWRGSRLNTEEALFYASTHGFSDLNELVAKNCDPAAKGFRSCATLGILQEFYRSVGNREDRVRESISRIASLDPNQLERRLHVEPEFRIAVRILVNAACEVNGGTCSDMRLVLCNAAGTVHGPLKADEVGTYIYPRGELESQAARASPACQNPCPRYDYPERTRD